MNDRRRHVRRQQRRADRLEQRRAIDRGSLLCEWARSLNKEITRELAVAVALRVLPYLLTAAASALTVLAAK